MWKDRKNDTEWIKSCTVMEVDGIRQRDAQERYGVMVLARI